MRSWVNVHSVVDRCGVLGPGERIVVWVQGCPLRCPGCTSPDTLPVGGGTRVDSRDLAERVVAQDGIRGVTLSGGEPFAQASALADVLDDVRTWAPHLDVMAYTGFRYEELLDGTAEQQRLLALIDLLVDGPYVRAEHGDLLWRGSRNQRLLELSGRITASDRPDASAGLEVVLDDSGSLSWTGVPAEPDFRRYVERSLGAQGFTLLRAPVEEGTETT